MPLTTGARQPGYVPRFCFCFCSLAVTVTGGRVRSFVRGEEPFLCTRVTIAPRSVCMGRHPSGSYIVNPAIAVFGSVYTGKQINSSDAVSRVIHMQESPPHKRFLVGCSSPFMRLAQHLTALRALGASDVCLVGENPTCSVPAL